MVAAAVAASLGSVAGAQELDRPVTIAGVVRDTAGHELLGAEVRVGRRYVITNGDGKFILDSVPPDTIPLSIRRIGYEAEDVLLVAKPGDRVEIAVRLTPIEVTLGTILVEGKRMDSALLKTGWYDREQVGLGVRFGPDYMDHFGGSMPGLLQQVPGIRIERDSHGRLNAFALRGSMMCALNVFLDGRLIEWARDTGIDNVLAVQDVLAVEVYRSELEMPQTFGRTPIVGGGGLPSPGGSVQGSGNPDCGALMIWTKPFSSGAKKKS